MLELPYAEDVNYWRTSKSSPDAWMDRTRRQIEKLGGQVLAEGFGSEPGLGRAAYMLAFELEGERYKVVWPVLPSKTGNERAARVQAVTLLYHDIKAKAISAAVLGARAAFFSFLMLPDGRTATGVATPELTKLAPAMLTAGPIIPKEEP
jgi:hypothetical protein